MTTGAPAGWRTTDENSVSRDGGNILAGDRSHTLTSEEVSGVGERALAAVRVRDGSQVEVYYSQWAGGDGRLRRVLHSFGDPLDALTGASAGWRYRGRQDQTTFAGGVDTLGLDAVYLLRDRDVRVYLPVWLGIPRAVEQTGASWAEQATDGVLVRVETFGECRRLREVVRFLKELFYRAVRRAWFDRQTARNLLALALGSDHTPGRVHTSGTPL